MIAADTETFWSAQYSITRLGLDRYVMNPLFKVTLVSLHSPDFEWVGTPDQLPVERLAGQTVLAHNADFDATVCRMAISKGQMPEFQAARWICTADMAAWHQYPRSLKGAYKHLFGEDLSKDARDEMKGLTPEVIAANPAFREYALSDARACYRIYEALAPSFPEFEFLLSELTRVIAARGLPVDSKLCQSYIDKLDEITDEYEAAIPWRVGHKPAPISSPLALGDACKLAGIEPPTSTNEDDPACMKWKAAHPEQAKWLDAMSGWRKANKLQESLYGLILRKRPDSRVSTRLKFCGAQHTARFSGSGGLNFQAIPRSEIKGISMKKCLAAPAGKVLVSVDLSQIEPRILHWLAGDMEFLSLVSGGIDLYEAHGRASGLYNEDEPMKDFAPELRHLCKARTLGLGYGCGAGKFASVAEALTGGKLKLSPAVARQQVAAYRQQNPLIIALWDKVEAFVRQQAKNEPECAVIETRSGKPIRYWDVEFSGKRDEMTAATVKGGPRKKIYSGQLVENLVQASAREIFGHMLIKAEAAGLPICLHVHDSITVEVAESEGQAALDLLVNIMSEAPAWAEGLPLAAEGEIRRHY